jgi:hypothetical protein
METARRGKVEYSLHSTLFTQNALCPCPGILLAPQENELDI